jgi:hypothetical protein
MLLTSSNPVVAPQTSQYLTCEHVKISGERCGSPAVRGAKLCYYHNTVRNHVPKNNMFAKLWNPRVERTETFAFDMPYPEDPESLQIAFAQFIHLVSQDLINDRRARLLLSALHGAAANLRLMADIDAQRQSAATKKPAAIASPEPQQIEQSA